MPQPRSVPPAPALICFSHLRWNFVFQRPQHLLTRFARERCVFYVEEPEFKAAVEPGLTMQRCDGVSVIRPVLPAGCEHEWARLQPRLIDTLITTHELKRYVLWFYTPMALAFTSHLRPDAIVYDCMDELSAFAHAPSSLKARETELLRRAQIVFTGGYSLYEAKAGTHPNVHAFPSSVDVPHFARARCMQRDEADQAGLPRPRLGFYGVIDERLDLELMAGLAAARPAWQIVMLGPIAKIDAAKLPTAPNLHYLGAKSYQDLPRYLAGWDVALLPFAHNEATRYISPTKTPEYLAAGKPVVSTSIRDVVRPYGERGLVRIADGVPAFVDACEAALAEDSRARTRAADAFLRDMSWDGTWARMRDLLDAAVGSGRGTRV